MVMASAGVNNMPDGHIDSEECRLRSRSRLDARRYAHRHHAAAASSAPAPAPAEEGEVQSPPPSSSSSSSSSEEESAAEEVTDAVVAAAPQLPVGAVASWPVAFGSVALAGRLREMEDTVSLHPSFCAWADGSPMHFFAVFDGHGGPHAAALCREQMHVILAEELAGAAAAFNRSQSQSQSWAAAAASSSSCWEQQDEQRAWRGALSRCFARADALAGSACACGRATLPACSCPLSSAQKGAIVGSTAVVALLVRDRLIVANCGDSRAVLSRGGVAIPLSEDQKNQDGRKGTRTIRLKEIHPDGVNVSKMAFCLLHLLLIKEIHPDGMHFLLVLLTTVISYEARDSLKSSYDAFSCSCTLMHGVDTLEENEFEPSLQHFPNYLTSINETPNPSKHWEMFYTAWHIKPQRIWCQQKIYGAV